MKRTLVLRCDTLTELAAADLENVVGAYQITQNCNTLDFCNIPTLPVRVCVKS
jgi:hypothetical protein